MEPGTVLAERWELQTQIAVGAMGRIFSATRRSDGGVVAVKILTDETAKDQESVQRFLREARVTQQLAHPNIVKVEGYGLTPEGRPYLVMELLEGENLEERLQRASPVPPGEVLSLVTDVAAALDAAHAAGVVHRDLKPANVVLARRPHGVVATVLDFGAAKITDHLGSGDGIHTAHNKLLGTPLYMSPEQIRSSRDVDHRTDVWALGVIAYELLAGAAPFDSGPLADLFVEILTTPIPRLSERVAGLPPAVDRWARRALERDPARRFQRASELSEALAVALTVREAEGRAPTASPHAVTQELPPGPLARRGWRLGALVVALGLLAGVLVALALAARG